MRWASIFTLGFEDFLFCLASGAKEFSKSSAYAVSHLGAIRHALYLPQKRPIVRNMPVSQERLGLIAAGAELTPVFWYPQGDVATAFVGNLGIGRDSLRDLARTFAAR